MKRTLFCYAVLSIVTFGGIVPYFCVSLVYSPYFTERNLDAEELVRLSNLNRVHLAEDYLSRIKGHQLRYAERLQHGELDILVAVKTVDRTSTNDNPETGYLSQTITALDREIESASSSAPTDHGLKIGLILCNVDPIPSRYREARTLALFFPTVERFASPDVAKTPLQMSRRNIEKEDYAYCLRAALNYTAKYVLIVEDDAQPYSGFLNSLSYVLNYRVLTKVVAGEPVRNERKWAYLRLYFPEKWTGYSWEVLHLCELIGVGSIAGSIGTWCRRRGSALLHFGLGAAYAVLVVLAVGRQHVMQIRRLWPAFLTVSPAYRCCTPAVLYPADVAAEIVGYLANVTCSSSFGVDLALDQFAEVHSYDRHLVQPNLVHHRGAYSTLTKPKIFKEFLFDS